MCAFDFDYCNIACLGSHFGSNIVFANIACKLYISELIHCSKTYNSIQKYVPKLINIGVMAVFKFAAAILAAILNISISPRGPEWGMRRIMNKQAIKYHKRPKNCGWTPMQGSAPCCRTLGRSSWSTTSLPWTR